MRRFLTALLIITTSFLQPSYAQTTAPIAAIVSNDTILQSEVDEQIKYYLANGNSVLDSMNCIVLEQLMITSLLISQATQEKVKVKDKAVEAELEGRLEYFIQVYGSEKRFEEATGKSMAEMRSEYRQGIKETLLVEKMKDKIRSEVTVSEEEVKAFFEGIPKDSLPIIPEEMEVYHIVIKPAFSEAAKEKAQADLMKIYTMAASGEREFEALAMVYSMDPGTVKNGGSLGEFGHGAMVPEFEKVVFKLKEGEVSQPFETEFGYHIVKVNKRLGDKVNASHILIIPELTEQDYSLAIAELNRIRDEVMTNSISFEEAVEKWSQDPSVKDDGGCIVHAGTGERMVPSDLMDAGTYLAVEGLKEGGISEPMEVIERHSILKSFHVVYVKRQIVEHVVDLEDDYMKLESAAKGVKQDAALETWVEEVKGRFEVVVVDEKCGVWLEGW
jgi:peptidyl-prolyl cis-trans isomerase SurA